MQKGRWLLVLACLLFPVAAHAAPKQIGTACKADASAFDWDTPAQCNGTTFVRGPIQLGTLAAPPYSATTCDATKAGMIQFSASNGFQGCNGTSWISLSGGSGTGSVPVGSIIAWPSATDPDDMSNWLECNGQTINSTDYPKLYALVGSKVPDLRGLFLRGLGSQSFSQNNGSTVGTTATTYASGSLGAVQGDAIRNFTGISSAFVTYAQSGTSGAITSILETSSALTGNIGGSAMRVKVNPSLVVPTASENRPVNMAVRYLIRSK